MPPSLPSRAWLRLRYTHRYASTAGGQQILVILGNELPYVLTSVTTEPDCGCGTRTGTPALHGDKGASQNAHGEAGLEIAACILVSRGQSQCQIA